jgi:hypothetical protein
MIARALLAVHLAKKSCKSGPRKLHGNCFQPNGGFVLFWSVLRRLSVVVIMVAGDFEIACRNVGGIIKSLAPLFSSARSTTNTRGFRL